MLIFIYGGSGSGKSAFAEQMITKIKKDENKLYYLATMQIFDAEDEERVKRHRNLRKDKGFITLEYPKDIHKAINEIEDKNADILLECMSNLLANELFSEMTAKETVSLKIKNDIELK